MTKTMDDSMMPFSVRRPRDRISVTWRRPLACRLQWTTRSIQDATVGTTKADEMISPARSGSVQILVTASGTQFAYGVYLSRTPPINRGVAGQSASTPSGDSSDINHLEPAAEYIDWFNHQHSGIGFHTPANVHYGHAAGVARERSATLAAARAKHPERFTTTTDPKILALPGPAWINQPKEITERSAA